VNSDPYGSGWMIKLRVKGEKSGLLTADAYKKQIG
jgi:glycine cleavage system H lipoate-binding protein